MSNNQGGNSNDTQSYMESKVLQTYQWLRPCSERGIRDRLSSIGKETI